jgi:diguanylate cyclase (GGDEF)-like protein
MNTATKQTRFDEWKVAGNLPSPTGAALRILELAHQDDTSIVEIGTILKSDPALAGKVLRVVNSAITGLDKPTADLSYAVSLLGLRTVRRLVLGFSVLSNCPRGVCHGFDFDEFWRHSLATALTIQVLSKTTTIVEPEEAYSLGLLSGIGRLALATVHPDRYSSILREVSEPCALVSAEQQAFGIDHRQLTALLLGDWGLPVVFVEAALYHEQPHLSELVEDSAGSELAYQLHFASCMADTWLASPENREGLLSKLLEAGRPLALTSEEVSGIADEAMADWSEWCDLLELKPADVVPLATTMQQLRENAALANTAATMARKETLRILVVDDDTMCLRHLERHLSRAGYDLATARTGLEALRVMLAFDPQVIITDWVMPEMDGLQLCRTIRQSDVGQRVYVIMVTSHEDKSRLTEAFAAGCDDYLTKPVHSQELCARIRAASRVIQMQKELSRENSQTQQYVAQLSIGNRELQREARTDSLTGLPNRRFAQDCLADAWNASVRLGSSLACIMVDVDHFKTVNDTYGHPVGDLVLQQTAAVLKKSLRQTDVLCRLGGEEFLIVCPGVDPDNAYRTAERLRECVENNNIASGPFTGSVTVSVGLSVQNARITSVDALLKSADDALYEAKRSGRNCVRVFGITVAANPSS